jgi:hypothetical protein
MRAIESSVSCCAIVKIRNGRDAVGTRGASLVAGLAGYARRSERARRGGAEPPEAGDCRRQRNSLFRSFEQPQLQPTFTRLLQPARSAENKTASSVV